MFYKLFLITLIIVAVQPWNEIFDNLENTSKWIFKNKFGRAVGLDGVLRGGPALLNVPNSGIGKWIFDSLKKMPKDFVILIQSETDQSMTADELKSNGTKLALALRSKYGVDKGDVVALVGANTVDMNVATMGTLFLGAVMAPMDPMFGLDDFEFLLNLYEAKVIIADGNNTEILQKALDNLHSNTRIITVEPMKGHDDLQGLISGVRNVSNFEPPKRGRKEAAAIVHTSGTSGQAKGVVLSHYALSYQTTLFKNYRRNILWLQASYMYWMSGVLLLIITSTNEGVPRILVRSTDSIPILKAIDKYQPKFTVMPPSLVEKIVDDLKTSNYDISSLTYISTTGSPLTTEIIDKIYNVIPNCTIGDEYGITEISGVLSYAEPPVNITSVGHPMPGIQIKIVDSQTKRTLGPNVEGDILAKSPAMFNEYIGQENETRNAFDKNGWFITGDLGKYTRSNVLYLTGRYYDVFFVDNHRVYASEIENYILSNFDDVDEVNVVQIKEDEKLVALVVLKQGATGTTEQDIVNSVKDHFPRYKQLTGGAYLVDEIPKTSTGKINRKELQDLAEEKYSESQNN